MLLLATGLKAQQEGYSKTYSYRGDTLRRFDYTGTNFLYNGTTGGIIFPYYSAAYQSRFLNQWLNLDNNGSIRHQVTEEIPNTTYFNYAIAYPLNSQGQFYASGSYKVYGDTFSTFFLQKKDTLLNTIWRQEYQLPFNGNISTIIPLDEQSILIQANLNRDSISSQYPAVHAKVNLLKTDTAGNLLWHRVVDSSEWNIVLNIIKAHDGNLILCGRTRGYGVTDGGAFVMKVDTAGNKLWHRVYDLPGYDGLEKMIATSDGNYVCVGWADTPPEIGNMANGGGRIIKIDADGNILLDTIIDYSQRTDEFRTVIEANNGDIVAIGNTAKYWANTQYNYEINSTRGPDGWALRLNPQGDEVWNRVFGHNAVDNCHDYLYNAMALPDGSFIATGSSEIPDTFYYEGQQIASKRQSAWVVKLNSDGCINPDCPGTLGSGKDVLEKESVRLFPNPGNGNINISSTKPFKAEAQLIVTDQLGRVLQQQAIPKNIQQYSFHLGKQAAGMYYIRLQNGKENYSFKYILNYE